MKFPFLHKSIIQVVIARHEAISLPSLVEIASTEKNRNDAPNRH